MSKPNWKTSLVAVALAGAGLVGCGGEEPATCTNVTVEGTSYCVYQGAITETGYTCPPEQPNLYRDVETELAVCSGEGERPPFEEVSAELSMPGTNPGPGVGDKHASCSEPRSSAMSYPLPDVNMEEDGTPSFMNYKSLGCETPDPQICTQDSDCEEENCVMASGDTQGVCATFDIDIWCDGEGEAMGYGDGTCWTCIPSEAHASACCAGLPGFDCRDWPFTGGGPGTVCATHENCEDGLICGDHFGSGYGICRCPELNRDDVVPPDTCF